MIKGIFGYIFHYSKSQQIKLLLFILLSFPFLYGFLDLPKTIINEAIGGKASGYEIFGFEFGQLSV